MKSSRWFKVTPYFILGAILGVTWINIMTTELAATPKHYAALIAFIIIGFIYLVSYRFGILFTGVLLVAATFNIVSCFSVTSTHSYFIKFGESQLTLPAIQWYPLLILIFYFILNYQYLVTAFKPSQNEPRN